METNKKQKCYCIFVKSGVEQEVADSINSLDGPYKAISPKRSLQEKRNNVWTVRKRALLPGYVFLYSESSEEHIFITRVNNMYSILGYDKDMHELIGDDRNYALWIHRNHGCIGSSKVLKKGDYVRVIDGPLLECSGKIIRTDKHKRRITVEFDFDGKKRNVSLSAEFVTEYEKQ